MEINIEMNLHELSQLMSSYDVTIPEARCMRSMLIANGFDGRDTSEIAASTWQHLLEQVAQLISEDF